MKLVKILGIFIVFNLLTSSISAKGRRRMMSRGRYAGLSQIGQNLGNGLKSFFDEDERP